MKKSLLFFALVLASYGTIQAQVTTSSMSGVVSQSTGRTIAGATIKATHVPSGTVYSASANDAGRFNLTNMRVGGPYRVEVTYVGQDPKIFEDLYLQLGQSFVLNPVLGEQATSLESITVRGVGRGNQNKTGASTNVGLRQIQELPQTSRSITEFTRLTPQSNGTSFAGRDARYNNLQIDGANFNNGFGTDANNILPGGRSQPISLDAIEEISVNIAPYDITQSGFTGAGINVITKSGTNKFHGTAYGFYNNEYLNGVKINEKNINFQDGTKSNIGFTLGGPLVKDKLFFFVSGEREAATGVNASGANLWRSSKDGVAKATENITRVKTDDLDAVQKHLRDNFGYDPGEYEGYANKAKQFGNKFLARIDWNINAKHKAAFRYNVLRGESMQGTNNNSGPSPRSSAFRISDQSMAFENANYSFENIVRSFTAELNSNFSSELSNKFLFTYSKIQEKRKSPSDHLFPFVDIWDGNVGGNGAVGTNNYMSFGTELFSYLNDVKNDNFSFTNNLTYNVGKHTFTGGVAFDVQKFGNSYTRNGTGYYRYASVADFLKTGTAAEVAPIMYGITYPYEGQDTYSRISFGLASMYAQDKITVNERFNFTVGLRAELPIYMNKLTANESLDKAKLLNAEGDVVNYSTGSWPKSRIMLSPRLGFNYDVNGDRSLILRGGTGIFSGRIPFVWLSNMPTNSGVIQNVVEPGNYAEVSKWIGNVRFHPEDIYYHVKNVPKGAEDVFLANPNGKLSKSSAYALVDKDFKMPSVWRSSFGIDYRIPNSPVTLTSDILYTKDINAVFQFGANRKVATAKMTYGGTDRDFYPNADSYTYNGDIGGNSATVLTNTKSKGYAFSATFGATVAPWHGLSGSVFYTHSTAKDVTGNNGSNGASAWSASPVANTPNQDFLTVSSFAVPHRVVANVSYTINNSTFGVYYNGSHQGRFSYYHNFDLNGDGVTNDLVFIPEHTSDLKFANTTVNGKVYTPEDQREAFDKFVANNGLEKYRGQILPRNEFLLPWLNRVDVRWTQNLFNNIATKGDKLQMTVDVVNIGNLLNSNWGVQSFVYTNGRAILGRSGNTASADPTFIMLNDGKDLVTSPYIPASTTGTTWTATLGLRYAF